LAGKRGWTVRCSATVWRGAANREPSHFAGRPLHPLRLWSTGNVDAGGERQFFPFVREDTSQHENAYPRPSRAAVRPAIRTPRAVPQHAARQRAADHRLRPQLRPRRGSLSLRRRGYALPGSAFGLRRVRGGPQPSQRGSGAAGRAGRRPREHGADGRVGPGRSSGGAAARNAARQPRQGLLLQLGDRGGGVRHQVRALRDAAPRPRLLRPWLPRALTRRALDQRRRHLPRRLRPPAARGAPHPFR